MPSQQQLTQRAPLLSPEGPSPAQTTAGGAGNAARAAQLPGRQGAQAEGLNGWGAAAAATATGSAYTAAPTREAVLGGATLERGHQGELVSWVQAALTRVGLPIGQTGQLGPQTESVITEFQRVWGVGQTGKVGKHTLTALTRAVTCSVSLDEFMAISPGVPKSTAKLYLPHLNASMVRANISSDARKAAYIAQLAHESDGFNTLEEYASGAQYEGRSDLGNTQKGDGKRFKGRGPIQITGRANYRSYGQAVGVDLIKDPALAATPGVGFQLAAEYWKRNDLNRYADRGEFDTVTQRINGGQNGRADRRSRWSTAKSVLAKNANKPKVVVKAPPPLAAQGPAAATGATTGAAGPGPLTGGAQGQGAGAAEQQGGALDSLMAPMLSGSYAGAAEAARQLAAAQPADTGAELRRAATALAAAALELKAATEALEAGDGPGARAHAHAGANGLRALRDAGHISPNLADPAVAEAGQLWRRAAQAKPGAAAAPAQPTPSPSPGPAPTPVAAPKADDHKTLSAHLSSAGALRLGARGAAVTALQRLLGMSGGGLTGLFGQTTLAVVKKAQRDAGLEADGVVGPNTLAALKPGGAPAGQAVGSYDAYRYGQHLGKIKIVRIDGVLMAQEMVPHWTRLKAAAARDGVRLKANSGFRTMDEQRALHQGYVNGTRGLAAAPGYSNHQHGEAIDIDVVSDAAYRWMFRNAPGMGWANTVPSEPWHWEYRWRR